MSEISAICLALSALLGGLLAWIKFHEWRRRRILRRLRATMARIADQMDYAPEAQANLRNTVRCLERALEDTWGDR